MQLLLILRFSSPQGQVLLAEFGFPVYAIWLSCSHIPLHYFVYQPFDYERPL